MNRHYDRYLTRKYAPLYRDRYGSMLTTAMCWGFECGSGWFDIINTLSRYLCWEWLEAQREYRRVEGRVGQLLYPSEEPGKFNYEITQAHVDEARERMEQAAEKTPVATQVKEKYGTLRFYVSGATDEQYAYIQFAEGMSAHVCEVCGNRGKRSGGYWVSTRCKEHEDD